MSAISRGRTTSGAGEPSLPASPTRSITFKNILEQILAELGRVGINSWRPLSELAVSKGIENPQALIIANVGQKNLDLPWYEAIGPSSLILENAIIASTSLSESERYELIAFAVNDPRGQHINWCRVVHEHLKSLGLSAEDLSAWQLIFSEGASYQRERHLLPLGNEAYLALISDRSLFENPRNSGETLAALTYALFQKERGGVPLISIDEQKKILSRLNGSIRHALVSQLIQRPELERLVAPLLPEGVLEVLKRTFDQVGLFTHDPELQAFIAIDLIPQLPFLNERRFSEVFWEDAAEKRQEAVADLFFNMARHSDKISKPFLDTIRYGFMWGVPSIKPSAYEKLKPDLLHAIATGFTPQGVSFANAQKIVASLFSESTSFYVALRQLYALGQFSDAMFTELASCEANEIPSTFIKLITYPKNLIDPYAISFLISQLTPENQKASFSKILSLVYTDLPGNKDRFLASVKWLELSKENLTDLVDVHMRHLGVPESSAASWRGRLANDKDLCILLPLYQNREFFISTQGDSPFSSIALITDGFDLAPALKDRCFQAMSEPPLDEATAALVALSCRGLTASQLSGLPFDSSKDQLLIALLLETLQKNLDDPSAPNLPHRIELMKNLPPSILLKLHTALMHHPKASSDLFQNMMRMNRVDLQEEHATNNSWEPIAIASLSKLPPRATQTGLQQSLQARLALIDPTRTEKKPVSWLANLPKEGWVAFKTLGRTQIFRKADGSCLALKWQKAKEERIELFKEMETLCMLRQEQSYLGLLSDYPTPIGVYEFEGDLPLDYFSESTVPVQASVAGEAKVAYCYGCESEDYFLYLHNPLETSAPKERIEKYALARHRLICDLFTLAKKGLIMSQMADIFHAAEYARRQRDEGGRYMAMNFLVREYLSRDERNLGMTGVGNGRLHHIESAVQYVNAGYSGLRDVGDSILLQDFLRPGFEFSKNYFSQILEKKPQQALTCILANFLSEYLLVYELTLTERMFNQPGNALDWRDGAKVIQLARELREGFHDAMAYYCGISSRLAKRFVEHASIDWERASRQLQFWSRKDAKGYVPFNRPGTTPEEIYGPGVEVVGQEWDERGLSDRFSHLQEGSEVTRHRGQHSGVDPVKEPERARVIVIQQMLMLEESRKQAESLYIEAQSCLKEGSPANLKKAAALYEESREYWPFDKRVYQGLQTVYTRLGEMAKAEIALKEAAALIIQKAFDGYLKRRDSSLSHHESNSSGAASHKSGESPSGGGAASHRSGGSAGGGGATH